MAACRFRFRVALSLLAFPAPLVRRAHGSFTARYLHSMQAVRVAAFGGPDVLQPQAVDLPESTLG